MYFGTLDSINLLHLVALACNDLTRLKKKSFKLRSPTFYIESFIIIAATFLLLFIYQARRKISESIFPHKNNI